MPLISETVTEMVQFVLPQHAGAPGQIHGGRMMEWIAPVGTMAASRFARSMVALTDPSSAPYARVGRGGGRRRTAENGRYVGYEHGVPGDVLGQSHQTNPRGFGMRQLQYLNPQCRENQSILRR